MTAQVQKRIKGIKETSQATKHIPFTSGITFMTKQQQLNMKVENKYDNSMTNACRQFYMFLYYVQPVLL